MKSGGKGKRQGEEQEVELVDGVGVVMKKFRKEQELYLECLAHRLRLPIQPMSGLTLKKIPEQEELVVGGELQDCSLMKLKDFSLEKVKTLKPGAATENLKTLGIKLVKPSKENRWKDYVLKPPVLIRKEVPPAPTLREMENRIKSQMNDSFRETIRGLRAGGINNGRLTFKRPGPWDEDGELEICRTNGLSSTEAKRPKFDDGITIIDVAEDTPSSKLNQFRSARDKLIQDDKRKGIKRNLDEPNGNDNGKGGGKSKRKTDGDGEEKISDNPELEELMSHDALKGFEPKIVEAILSEVMEQQKATDWDDIAGLEGPKAVIKEIIIWPMLRPDIFTGLRTAPKGILLFGPPGTGKTMIGRLIATQSSSTFFNISASSLTSKWIGDGEKLVRCLFQVARIKQPSVIFIDEIDSILTQRSDSEHESSRRMKTEFLVQFDGCGTSQDDRVLVIGVTNRPQELDEAARRRLVKRIYIPLPDIEGRKQMVTSLMKDQNTNLSEDDTVKIAEMTEGYSGADMRSFCQEASYGPIRDVGHMLAHISAENVRPIELKDFEHAVKRVKSSVALKDLNLYEDWDSEFGCHIGD